MEPKKYQAGMSPGVFPWGWGVVLGGKQLITTVILRKWTVFNVAHFILFSTTIN